MRLSSITNTALLALVLGFSQVTRAADPAPAAPDPSATTSDGKQTAVFGLGCFWCAEALFERFEGVSGAVNGYAGGTTANPTYEEVCTETTGHAEVVKVTFDPKIISYEKLLEIFFDVHNPTTKDRQGNDVGSSYRSIILTQNDEQARLAQAAKLAAQEKYKNPIVTEIEPLKEFYVAEGYHQDYYANHPDEPYCQFVISPKLEKLEKTKASQLKPAN